MLIPGRKEPRDRLIVALDIESADDALRLVDLLDDRVTFYKIGLELFVAAGPDLVRRMVEERGKSVFLDLKSDDVPEQITRAVAALARQKIHFLTLHGGVATIKAAVAGRGSSALPRLLHVTLLSSLDETDLRNQGLVGPPDKARFQSLMDYVLWRASEAVKNGSDGLIASGFTIESVRQRVGSDPVIVTPAIRPGKSTTDDHKRTMTPRQAIDAGADYLVVGRPIRNAKDPAAAAEEIVAEIEQAVAAQPRGKQH